MVLSNMQKLEMRGVKQSDVGVTGMVCKGSRTFERFQAPILSVRLPLPGLYPIVSADAVLGGNDNPQAAEAERAGRSERQAGVFAGARLARSASGAMRSTWSVFPFEHRNPKALFMQGTKARG
jgi:hypothetical protein